MMNDRDEELFEKYQTDEPLDVDETPQCSPGWGDRCAQSKSRKCRCACGGRNHGKQANWRIVKRTAVR